MLLCKFGNITSILATGNMGNCVKYLAVTDTDKYKRLKRQVYCEAVGVIGLEGGRKS